MKTKSWTALAVLLAIFAAALWAGCGSDSKSDGASSSTGNSTDRAFVADMVPHHKSAVQMTVIAEGEATSPFVKRLAKNIADSQNAEIAQMQAVDSKLAAAGIKKGKLGTSHSMPGMDMDAQELQGAKPFDAKFIAMMLPHHEAAIPMARAELAKGKNAELKKRAKNIIATQTREIKQMRDHTKASGTGGRSTSPKMDDGMESGHSKHSG